MSEHQQINLFSSILEEKKITKPIRLIEFFAGIGSQYKALKQLTDKVESYKICEWAYNSILAYNYIHIRDFTDYAKDKSKEELVAYLNGNISTDYNEPCDCTKKSLEWLKSAYNNCIATHNLINIMKVHGQDLEIVDTDKYEYIMTYSFPCQDLSLAGLGKGMSVSQAEGGTRSGLLWEVERILDELKPTERPQILLMENVPQVIGANNIKDFQKWETKLASLGYSNYIQILNAKNYGIPQNRQRCFMVSLLGDYDYYFPREIQLKYRLKDFLEKDVDEKYYLSEKMVEYIKADNEKWTGNNGGAIVNRDIGCTINTAPTLTACDYKNPVKITESNNTFVAQKYKEFGSIPEMFNPYNTEEITNIAPAQTTQCGSTTSSATVLIKEETLKKELCNELIKKNKETNLGGGKH